MPKKNKFIVKRKPEVELVEKESQKPIEASTDKQSQVAYVNRRVIVDEAKQI